MFPGSTARPYGPCPQDAGLSSRRIKKTPKEGHHSPRLSAICFEGNLRKGVKLGRLTFSRRFSFFLQGIPYQISDICLLILAIKEYGLLMLMALRALHLKDISVSEIFAEAATQIGHSGYQMGHPGYGTRLSYGTERIRILSSGTFWISGSDISKRTQWILFENGTTHS